MECAPHRMWKKLMALVLSLVMMAVMLPGALAVDLNVDAGFYFKQSRGGTCTLASAAMMLRRRAFLDGLTDWTDVTENSVRGSAWSGGLAHSFNYNAMQVGYATLPSGTEAKKQTLIQLLAEHPEGIVLYDRSRPHAVLLTDYTDGVFYCSDPAGSVSLGRVPISAASISIAGASCYWYITSDQNSGTALFAYAVLKGVRLGYLPKRMAAWAEKAFYGTCDKYLSKNPDGSLQLGGICLVAGLGGKDHRDGSLAYYFSEPVVCNDAKGVGPLVLAYTEMIARKN